MNQEKPKKQTAKVLAEAAQKAAIAEAEAIQKACNVEVGEVLKKHSCTLIGVPAFGPIQGSNAWAVGCDVAIRYAPAKE
jgi:hypothetical protein